MHDHIDKSYTERIQWWAYYTKRIFRQSLVIWLAMKKKKEIYSRKTWRKTQTQYPLKEDGFDVRLAKYFQVSQSCVMLAVQRSVASILAFSLCRQCCDIIQRSILYIFVLRKNGFWKQLASWGMISEIFVTQLNHIVDENMFHCEHNSFYYALLRLNIYHSNLV